MATAPVRPVEYDSPTADFADVSTASLRRAVAGSRRRRVRRSVLGRSVCRRARW
ncbi:hypothetical protein XA26_26680 [Mycolicibacterium fortuitum]|uniref:Uncharacterized protein n=1 Tax=Mycolicibacterium fortuitum TaxID=1766 RepID=A0A0N9XRS5_MYCFO|nr:hypothetical protein XA26_26680 [Mycolicibacterium fortuitum]